MKREKGQGALRRLRLFTLTAGWLFAFALSVSACGPREEGAEPEGVEGRERAADPSESLPESAPADREIPADAPGRIENGVFLSGDGRFTLQADEAVWEVSELDGMWELRMVKEPVVSVSFQPSAELKPEQTEHFDEGFSDHYVEGLREVYPDAKKKEVYLPRQNPSRDGQSLAGMSVTMTDPSGKFLMRQYLYLAAEEAGGYFITCVIPETAEEQIGPIIRELAESFEFIDHKQKEEENEDERTGENL